MDYLGRKAKKSHIVLFDVCGTLFYSNTTFDFLSFFFKDNKEYQKRIKLFKSLPAKIISKILFTCTGFDAVRYFALMHLKGEEEEKIKRLAEIFVDSLFSHKRIDNIHAMLLAAQKEGKQVCLISASLDVIIEIIANKLEVDGWHASRLLFHNRTCSGKIVNDLYGRKRHIVNRYKEEYRVISFITDNFNDVNVRDLVTDFQVVTNKKDAKNWAKKKYVSAIYEK